jgi:L-ectoine synthase
VVWKTSKGRKSVLVRTLDELKANGQYRENPGVWSSSRYLLRDDGIGFTLTQTTVAAGQSQEMEYKNHIEANLVIEGRGQVSDLATGEIHDLEPGTMYTLDKHDRHRIEALTDMRLVCVFTPALVGPETHDADGSYPIL